MAISERPLRVIQRQRDRGKLLVRERVDAILDDDSPFLELSPLAAWDMYGGMRRRRGL